MGRFATRKAIALQAVELQCRDTTLSSCSGQYPIAQRAAVRCKQWLWIMGMPRLAAPALWIALLLIAASCSQIAQKEDDRKEVGRQLTDAYYSCVRTSFASQRPTMVDRNMAIDQAFAVCQTEESKLEAFENPQHLNVSTAGSARHRNTLKDELLRR